MTEEFGRLAPARVLGWVQSPHGQTQHRTLDGTTTLCGQRLGPDHIRTNSTRHACPKCVAADPARVVLIERILDYLSGLTRFQQVPHQLDHLRINPHYFDRAEPFLWTDLTHTSVTSIQVNLTPAQVRWRLDVPLLSCFDATDRIVDEVPSEGDWHLQRWRRLAMPEVRGQLHPYLPYPMAWTLGVPDTGFVHRFTMGYVGGGQWRFCDRHAHRGDRSPVDADLAREMSLRAQIALGLWALRPYQWRVYFAEDDRPGVEMPTDAVGARAAFRLRDLPPGRDRRAALRHWVREHWRQSRDDPTEERLVRAHLRGAERFVWNGLHCQLTPALVTQEDAAEAIEQRALRRREGTDRRRVLVEA